MRVLWITLGLSAAVISAACESPTDAPFNQCPPPQGDLGAQACAIVEGRAVTSEGDPIPSLVLRVDSVIDRRWAYLSQIQTTNANGRFRMKVLRMSAAPSPGERELDAVAIEATLGGSISEPGPRLTSEPLSMEFAPMGERADVTEVELIFDFP